MIGWWVRWQACKMAAQVMQGRVNGDEAITPLVWSLTVFFEQYLRGGADNTLADFGPKEAIQLKEVK